MQPLQMPLVQRAAISFTTLLLLLVGVSLVGSPAFAQQPTARATAHVDLTARLKDVRANPKATEELLKVGKGVASFCANCHGQGGNSLNPEIPNLAGQNPVYLLEQLRRFSTGQRRNEFMEGMIKALTADEKIGMVLFYASQRATPHPASVAPGVLIKGKDIYSQVCWHCHGQDGHGGENFARIAGQQMPYMTATLKRYRSGTGTRIDPLMMTSTRNLTDDDIAAVAAFISGME